MRSVVLVNCVFQTKSLLVHSDYFKDRTPHSLSLLPLEPSRFNGQYFPVSDTLFGGEGKKPPHTSFLSRLPHSSLHCRISIPMTSKYSISRATTCSSRTLLVEPPFPRPVSTIKRSLKSSTPLNI